MMKRYLDIDPKDVRAFAQKSDRKASWILLFNYLMIAVAFALPAFSFNPLTVLLCLILLANRQLGLAILMHECSHYTFFKTRHLNQLIGRLFCAAPVLANIDGYRNYHLQHHAGAGTKADPDYPNYKNYPVTKQSWRRKIVRDFVGITGLKLLYAIFLMNAGLLKYDMSYQSNTADKSLSSGRIGINLLKNFALPLCFHLTLWGLLNLFGQASLYILWWISYFTVYMFIIRVRNAAEHGSVPNLLDKNPLLHARTTYASWWERLIFAPNYVNYHLEHHLRPNIPCYHLKAFHHYLLDKGYLKETPIATGYSEVIRQLNV